MKKSNEGDEVSLVPDKEAPPPPSKIQWYNPITEELHDEKPKIYRLTIGSLIFKIEQPPLVVSILLALGVGFLVVKLAEIAAFVIIVLALLSAIVYMPRNLPEDKDE